MRQDSPHSSFLSTNVPRVKSKEERTRLFTSGGDKKTAHSHNSKSPPANQRLRLSSTRSTNVTPTATQAPREYVPMRQANKTAKPSQQSTHFLTGKNCGPSCKVPMNKKITKDRYAEKSLAWE